MKKNIFSFILIFLLSILLFTNCKNKVEKIQYQDNVYLQSTSVDEFFYGLISSYSSGLISKDDPLIIQFNEGITLKKQYGEKLSPSVFSISPKLKGSAYWIDDYTIGYKIEDNPSYSKAYKVHFNISEFIEVDKTIPDFEYDIAFKQQSFNVSSKKYIALEDDKCEYLLTLDFINKINATDVLEMLDSKIKNNYDCSTKNLDFNKVELKISDIDRKAIKNKSLLIKLNGDNIDIDKKEDVILDIPSANSFEFMGYEVDNQSNTVYLMFSNYLDPYQNLNGLITTDHNKMSFKQTIENNIISVNYSFDNYYDSKDRDITLTIYSSIKDENKNILPEDYEVKFNTTSHYPLLHWVNNGVIVPTGEDATLYFKAVNLKYITVRFIKIYDNNILNFLGETEDLSRTWGIRKVGRFIKKVDINLENEGNDLTKPNVYPIVLKDYIDIKPGELYQVIINANVPSYLYADQKDIDEYNRRFSLYDFDEENFWDKETYYYLPNFSGENYWDNRDNPKKPDFYSSFEASKNVFITDIGLSVKASNKDVLEVFARNILTAEPLKGCNIKAYNYQKQVIAEDITNNLGHCILKCDKKPYFVEAKDSDGNRAFLVLDNNKSLSYSKFDVSGTEVQNDINAFLYSNRNIWRPGDSINLFLMLNYKNNIIPKNLPIVLEVYDSEGRFYKKIVDNNPKGNIYSFKFKTEVYDNTGTWYTYAKVGNNTFNKNLRIETIKPNRLKINLDLPEDYLSLYNVNNLNLSAEWLTGGNPGGLKATVEATVYENYKQVVFDKFSSYNFVSKGTQNNNVSNNTINLFNSNLNGLGNTNISLKPLKDAGITNISKVNFVTKVFEKGGDFSISSSLIKVSPYKQYIGVKYPSTDDYFYAGIDNTFDVVVVSEDGKLIKKVTNLDVKVYKISDFWWLDSYDRDISKYISGNYAEPIFQKLLQTNNGKASFNLNIKENSAGAYLIVIKDLDQGFVFSDIVNFASSYFDLSNKIADLPAILELESDKDEYKVGDEITVKFSANKNSKALVSVESSSRIIKTIEVDNLSEKSKISFTADRDMVPSVYINVLLYQPYQSKSDLPIRLYGILPVKVVDSKSKLNPKIKMPKETNSNTKIDISVSEQDGKHMYYTITLVDEGVLGMTGYKTEDPYNYFNSKYALNIRTWDNYRDIVDAYTGELNSVSSVGGDATILNRQALLFERFSAIAYAKGPFELKAGETKTHTFEIPEYMGNLRAMVVACDGKNAFGSVSENIEVKDPLMIMPTIPRVFSPNDEITIPVQLLSNKKSGNVTLSLSTSDLDIIKDIPQNVQINNGKSEIVEFKVKVPEKFGASTIKIKGDIDGYIAESKTTVPIRMPYTKTFNSISKEIKENSTFDYNFEDEFVKGTSKSVVSVGSFLPVDLNSRVNFLITYPHGCLEQVVSKGFAQLYLDKFVDLTEEELNETKFNINTTIKSINRYLTVDNYLSYWPNGNYTYAWAEIYALHFLTEAKKLGYDVEKELYNTLIRTQQNLSNNWQEQRNNPNSTIIQSYRLFVLALSDKANVGAMNRLKNNDNIKPLGKSLLASAYSLVGKNSIAKKLIAEVDFYSEELSDISFGNNIFGSALRDFAIVTYSEMLINKNSDKVRPMIEKIGEELSSSNWMSTQTTSFALFTLFKYADIFNVNKENTNVDITINNTNKNIYTTIPIINYTFEPKANNTISIKNKGETPVFATIYNEGYKNEYATIASGNGCKLDVEYFDNNNKPLDVSSLDQNTDFYVKFTVTLNNLIEYANNLTLTYLIPSGWEIINQNLFNDQNNKDFNYVDYQDDRVSFYFDLMYNNKISFIVKLNATYKGDYIIPQVECNSMYNNNIYYTYPAQPVRVK